jgi:hypothetical protein
VHLNLGHVSQADGLARALGHHGVAQHAHVLAAPNADHEVAAARAADRLLLRPPQGLDDGGERGGQGRHALGIEGDAHLGGGGGQDVHAARHGVLDALGQGLGAGAQAGLIFGGPGGQHQQVGGCCGGRPVDDGDFDSLGQAHLLDGPAHGLGVALPDAQVTHAFARFALDAGATRCQGGFQGLEDLGLDQGRLGAREVHLDLHRAGAGGRCFGGWGGGRGCRGGAAAGGQGNEGCQGSEGSEGVSGHGAEHTQGPGGCEAGSPGTAARRTHGPPPEKRKWRGPERF